MFFKECVDLSKGRAYGLNCRSPSKALDPCLQWRIVIHKPLSAFHISSACVRINYWQLSNRLVLVEWLI